MCALGAGCWFAHTRDELRPVVRGEDYRTKKCVHRPEKCWYKWRCSSYHAEEERRYPYQNNGMPEFATKPSMEMMLRYLPGMRNSAEVIALQSAEEVARSVVEFVLNDAPPGLQAHAA